jgi:tetratricopeptide (TPR) repeat protein
LLALDRTRDAQAALEGAVPLLEAAGDLNALAQAFDNLSNILYFSDGDFEKARAYLQRGLEVAERMGDPAVTAHMLFMMGTSWIWTSNQEEGRRLFERVQTIVRDRSLGESRVASQPLFGFAYLDSIYGDGAKARQEWEEAIRVAEQTGALPMVRWASRWLAEIDLQAGEHAKVIDRLELLLQRPGFEDSPTLLSPLAEAYAAAGRETEAQAAAELSVRKSREQDNLINLVDAQHAAAVVAIRRQQWDDARRHLQAGLDLVRGMGYMHGEAWFLVERAKMHATQDQVAESRQDLEHALGIFRGIGATNDARRAEQALAGIQIGP